MRGAPCVLVVGMARSGTSAVTELLSQLHPGLPPAADLMPGDRWNAHGYFESLQLTGRNEELLDAWGASLTSPPRLPGGWATSTAMTSEYLASRQAFDRVFPPGAPALWKDPRLCLLLPFWRQVLADRPLAAVLVWRHPLAVARSLRDHLRGVVDTHFPDRAPTGLLAVPLAVHGRTIGLEHAVALWESFNRAALEGLAGMDVLVAGFDTVVADPWAFAARAARWLDGLDPSRPARRPGAVPAVDVGLRHHRAGDPEAGLSPSQAALLEGLARLEGTHRSFTPPALPPPAPATVELLAAKGRMEAAAQRAGGGSGLEGGLAG